MSIPFAAMHLSSIETTLFGMWTLQDLCVVVAMALPAKQGTLCCLIPFSAVRMSGASTRRVPSLACAVSPVFLGRGQWDPHVTYQHDVFWAAFLLAFPWLKGMGCEPQIGNLNNIVGTL